MNLEIKVKIEESKNFSEKKYKVFDQKYINALLTQD